MKITKKPLTNLAVATALTTGVLAGVATPSAMALTPSQSHGGTYLGPEDTEITYVNLAATGLHRSTPASTKLDATNAVAAYIKTVKAAGDIPTSSNVLLTDKGWVGEIYYMSNDRASMVLKGDVWAPTATDLRQLQGAHVVNGFTSKADATAHLVWAENELAKQPNSFVETAGLTTTSTVGGKTSYGYVTLYFTSGKAAFGGDKVNTYVETDHDGGGDGD